MLQIIVQLFIDFINQLELPTLILSSAFLKSNLIILLPVLINSICGRNLEFGRQGASQQLLRTYLSSTGSCFFSKFPIQIGSYIEICFMLLFSSAVELVSPKNRLWVTFIINGAYTIGDVLVGSVGYYFRYWRHFLLIIYLPGGLFISYFW